MWGKRFGILDGLRQEVVQIQDLDAALTHLQHEVVVVLLGLVDPDHVVEQQLAAVAGREPLVREAGPADHHGPELADLRVDTEAAQVQRSLSEGPGGRLGAVRQGLLSSASVRQHGIVLRAG